MSKYDKNTCWDDREKDRDPRTSTPNGFEYICIVTPYGHGMNIEWFDGLGKDVDLTGGILLPRNVCKDGTFYFFKPTEQDDCGVGE